MPQKIAVIDYKIFENHRLPKSIEKILSQFDRIIVCCDNIEECMHIKNHYQKFSFHFENIATFTQRNIEQIKFENYAFIFTKDNEQLKEYIGKNSIKFIGTATLVYSPERPGEFYQYALDLVQNKKLLDQVHQKLIPLLTGNLSKIFRENFSVQYYEAMKKIENNLSSEKIGEYIKEYNKQLQAITLFVKMMDYYLHQKSDQIYQQHFEKALKDIENDKDKNTVIKKLYQQHKKVLDHYVPNYAKQSPISQKQKEKISENKIQDKGPGENTKQPLSQLKPESQAWKIGKYNSDDEIKKSIQHTRKISNIKKLFKAREKNFLRQFGVDAKIDLTPTPKKVLSQFQNRFSFHQPEAKEIKLVAPYPPKYDKKNQIGFLHQETKKQIEARKKLKPTHVLDSLLKYLPLCRTYIRDSAEAKSINTRDLIDFFSPFKTIETNLRNMYETLYKASEKTTSGRSLGLLKNIKQFEESLNYFLAAKELLLQVGEIKDESFYTFILCIQDHLKLFVDVFKKTYDEKIQHNKILKIATKNSVYGALDQIQEIVGALENRTNEFQTKANSVSEFKK